MNTVIQQIKDEFLNFKQIMAENEWATTKLELEKRNGLTACHQKEYPLCLYSVWPVGSMGYSSALYQAQAAKNHPVPKKDSAASLCSDCLGKYWEREITGVELEHPFRSTLQPLYHLFNYSRGVLQKIENDISKSAE